MSTMKINVLNEKLNVNPEKVIEVSREQFFRYFFRVFLLKNEQTLSDNEIKLLSCLCANKDPETIGITKSNLIPVYKKLEQKGLLVDKKLSPYTKTLQEKFTNSVEMLFNFKIIDDDTGQDN